jgi:hypothetical protein
MRLQTLLSNESTDPISIRYHDARNESRMSQPSKATVAREAKHRTKDFIACVAFQAITFAISTLILLSTVDIACVSCRQPRSGRNPQTDRLDRFAHESSALRVRIPRRLIPEFPTGIHTRSLRLLKSVQV